MLYNLLSGENSSIKAATFNEFINVQGKKTLRNSWKKYIKVIKRFISLKLNVTSCATIYFEPVYFNTFIWRSI